VQYFRFAKGECWEQERERKKSALAKRRHEARNLRLARMEAEKKARLEKKKAALKKKTAGENKSGVDDKKAAIQAAIERAAKKKAEQSNRGIKPANTKQLTAAQQKQIEQSDARRSAPIDKLQNIKQLTDSIRRND
jgi:electron transport complex protein RnfC